MDINGLFHHILVLHNLVGVVDILLIHKHHGVEQVHKQRIVGHFHQLRMESQVVLFPVFHGLAAHIPLQVLPQSGNFFVRAVLDHHTECPEFQRHTQMNQVLHRATLQHKKQGQTVVHTLQDVVHDKISAALTGLHNPLHFQRLQRLPDGRPADAQHLHQLPLRRELRAQRQFSLNDGSLDLIDDGLIILFLLDGCKHGVRSVLRNVGKNCQPFFILYHVPFHLTINSLTINKAVRFPAGFQSLPDFLQYFNAFYYFCTTRII